MYIMSLTQGLDSFHLSISGSRYSFLAHKDIWSEHSDSGDKSNFTPECRMIRMTTAKTAEGPDAVEGKCSRNSPDISGKQSLEK